jgi:hypothetical protein
MSDVQLLRRGGRPVQLPGSAFFMDPSSRSRGAHARAGLFICCPFLFIVCSPCNTLGVLFVSLYRVSSFATWFFCWQLFYAAERGDSVGKAACGFDSWLVFFFLHCSCVLFWFMPCVFYLQMFPFVSWIVMQTALFLRTAYLCRLLVFFLFLPPVAFSCCFAFVFSYLKSRCKCLSNGRGGRSLVAAYGHHTYRMKRILIFAYVFLRYRVF